MNADGWEIISSETHFRNDHLEVASVEVRTPARPTPRPWTIVRRKRAVVVAPMREDGKLILIRQERIPIQAAIWEMPAGQVDDATEIEAVALRELQEETGYELAVNGQLIALGDYFSSPGFTDEHGYFFLARPVQLNANGNAHDESESILDCRAFSVGEIRGMIDRNEIRDANTLSICARLIARGLLSLA
ncbi:MAG: NUDIX hydrolase [Verrucomicrobiota bacterium]